MNRTRFLFAAILSTTLLVDSVGVANATTTPKPIAIKNVNPATSKYQADLAAYKVAFLQYRVQLVENEIAYRPALKAYWASWTATNQAFNLSWQATWVTYKTANDSYQAKYKPLNAIKDAALNAADVAFTAAALADSSVAGIEAALKTHATATAAAASAFKAAIAPLGVEPLRPVKPADPVKPSVPTKPTPPVKPIAPVKPPVVAKPTPTK